MARRDRTLPLGLLAVVTLVVVAAIGASIYRMMSAEDEDSLEDLRQIERLESAPRSTTAEDQATILQAIGPDGLIAVNIKRFVLHTQRYPSTLRDLVERPIEMGPDEDWGGPFLVAERLLKDPWNQTYQYRAPGRHNPTSYDLWSIGPDGVSETGDDVGNW